MIPVIMTITITEEGEDTVVRVHTKGLETATESQRLTEQHLIDVIAAEWIRLNRAMNAELN